MDGTTSPRRVPKHHGLSAKTLRRLEHASGSLASASIAVMERRLLWFTRLPADQRASVLLITQAGAAGFVDWLRDSKEALKLTTEAFRDAPAELSRWVSLRQAVGMVRLAIEVFEEQLPEFAANAADRAALIEGILRYGREIAFAAANSYAAAARPSPPRRTPRPSPGCRCRPPTARWWPARRCRRWPKRTTARSRRCRG